ncbi:MAG TPA: family 16 glycoside hydrolase, partial [Gemmataceae bacterium]|nr:family 16 glycoside hydrolase [Gemmataceae bacterium]
MPSDPNSVKAIFLSAIDRPTSAERNSYLDEACAGDSNLRQRIDSLLKAHAESGSFPDFAALAEDADGTEALDATPEDVTRTRTDATSTGEESILGLLAPPRQSENLGRLGDYEIQSIIGQGGMGIVLKAIDERLNRVVAVKILAPQYAANAAARKRFIREARNIAAVVHEHVVAVHFVSGDGDPHPYLVMQLVQGVSLQERLDLTGPLELKEILRIGLQTARGLAAAHAQGLVHRDIKPANILLENGVERVKITDFGLARAVDDASVTTSGVIAGTPMFMSPEQAEGKQVDARSDLFSLGSVLYALCTGRPPFRATGTMAVMKRVIEDTPRPVREINPDIPDWLEAIIAKLHAKKPEERFQSAKEVAELLEQHLAHLQQPSKVPMPAKVEVPAATSLSGGAEEKAWKQLLDATDYFKRLLQHGLLGVAAFFLLIGAIAMFSSAHVLGTAIVTLFGCVLGVVCSFIRQKWIVSYKGRFIRFQNSAITGEELFVDGQRVARGEIGIMQEFYAVIPNGPGAGDQLRVVTHAGFFSFGCKIYAREALPAAKAEPSQKPLPPRRRRWRRVAAALAIVFLTAWAVAWFGPAVWLYSSDKCELTLSDRNPEFQEFMVFQETGRATVSAGNITVQTGGASWHAKPGTTLTLEPGKYRVEAIGRNGESVGRWREEGAGVFHGYMTYRDEKTHSVELKRGERVRLSIAGWARRPELPEPKLSNDERLLQGAWVPVSGLVSGIRVPEADFKGGRLVFAVRDVTISSKGVSGTTTYVVDSIRVPKTISFGKSPPGPPQNLDLNKEADLKRVLDMANGIFRNANVNIRNSIFTVDEDTLTLCCGPADGPFPDKFESPANSNIALYVFKREGKQPSSDKDRLQGTWVIDSHMLWPGAFAGKNLSQEELKQIKLVFTGGQVRFHMPGGKVEGGTFKLDPAAHPAAEIDVIDMNDQKGLFGIYSLTGDNLVICMTQDKDRPTQFMAKAGTTQWMLTLRKVPPDELADKDRLQGAWVGAPGEPKLRLTFAGNRIQIEQPGKAPEGGTFQLVPTAEPKQFDVVGDDQKKRYGIYQLVNGVDGQAQVLQICMGEDRNARPVEFKSDPQFPTRLNVVLQRAPAREPTDLEKLQGVWIVTEVEAKGQQMPPQIMNMHRMTLTVRGQAVNFKSERLLAPEQRTPQKDSEVITQLEGLLTVNPQENPKQITISTDAKEALLAGVYRFEGDKLRICYTLNAKPEQIPREFATKPGQEWPQLMVLKRLPASQPSEDGWVQLFNGKDLTGWKSPGIDAWKVENGVLVGRGGRHYHYLFHSREDFENFHLRAEARINRLAATARQEGKKGVYGGGIYFLCDPHTVREFGHPDVLGYKTAINDQDHGLPRDTGFPRTGSLLRACPPNIRQVTLAEGGFDLPDDWFTLEIIALGGRLTVKVNGTTTADVVDATYTRGSLALQNQADEADEVVQFRKIEIKELPPEEPAWVQLFNGKDLTGWKTHPDQPGEWKVEDGILVGRGPKTSHLFSERADFRNFHVRVEAKLNRKGESSVFFRSPFGFPLNVNGAPWPGGFDADIQWVGNAVEVGHLAMLGPKPVLNQVEIPADTWFTLEIFAEGDRIIVKANNRITADYTDSERKYISGHIALQVFKPDTVVHFRKIEVQELPAAFVHGGTIAGWGKVIDPNRDCKFTGTKNEVAITVPAGHHNLNPAEPFQNLSAPRVLQNVKGDFDVQVQVLPFTLPAPKTATTGINSFVGAGLLVWQDSQNFIRLLRAGNGESWGRRPFAALEIFRDGKPAFTRYVYNMADEPTSLRAVRRGKSWEFFFSNDGENWTEIPCKFDPFFANDLELGIAATNSTTAEHVARLRKFDVKEPPPSVREVPKRAADVIPFMAGNWKVDMQVVEPKPPPEKAKATGYQINDYVADGKFLRMRAATEDGSTAAFLLYSYDAGNDGLTFRGVFSDGNAHDNILGRFSPDDRSVLWLKRHSNGNQFVHQLKFVDSNTITSRNYTQDESGKVISEIRITFTRAAGPITLPNLPVDPKRPAQMAVLDKLIGEWQSEVTVKEGTPSDKPKTETMRTKAQEILGGRFIEELETFEPENTSHYSLFWFDAATKLYRYWFFHGAGYFFDGSGTWDEATKTMTWSSAGGKLEGRWVFKGDDQHEFHHLVKGKDGETLYETTGVSRRIPSGWVQLFNGKDLTGWKTHSDQPGDWKVEDVPQDPRLVGRGAGSHLFSERGDYENFHLRVEAIVTDPGAFGVYYRSGF